jgi:hypothetical protein
MLRRKDAAVARQLMFPDEEHPVHNSQDLLTEPNLLRRSSFVSGTTVNHHGLFLSDSDCD